MAEYDEDAGSEEPLSWDEQVTLLREAFQSASTAMQAEELEVRHTTAVL